MASCKPGEMDLVMPKSEQKVVLSSQYVNGGMLVVSLTKSFDAGSSPKINFDSTGVKMDERLLISDAEVWISSGGFKKQLLAIDKGVFALEENILQDGMMHTITVVQNGREIASASDNKMPFVSFDSVSVYRSGSASSSVLVEYRVKNQVGAKQYFVVNYFTKKEKDTIPALPDPAFIAKRMLEQNVSFDLFTSDDFQNGFYRVNKTVSSNYTSDTLVLSLSNVSEGYYRFLQAQKRAGSLFNQMRGEVINFPSNIRGGYGYFQLSEPDIRVMQVIK
jgi:hypothetical protein